MTPENPHYFRCLEALKGSIIFKDLDSIDIQHLIKKMTRIKWTAGVFKRSFEFNSSLHVIVSGRLKMYQINPSTGREHTIYILTKGDVFDVMHLMDNKTHDVYWETLDDLEILTISIIEVNQIIEENPKIYHSILKYIGHMMRMLEEESNDICLHNTLTRLSHLLLKHMDGESHQLKTINNLPNNEIANLIGTTRAVVNRHIQELKKAGAISVKRKHIDIENLDTLIAIAEEKYTNI